MSRKISWNGIPNFRTKFVQQTFNRRALKRSSAIQRPVNDPCGAPVWDTEPLVPAKMRLKTPRLALKADSCCASRTNLCRHDAVTLPFTLALSLLNRIFRVLGVSWQISTKLKQLGTNLRRRRNSRAVSSALIQCGYFCPKTESFQISG
jgi:hypothetical protein